MGKEVTAVGELVTLVGHEKERLSREIKKHAATIHCSNSLSLLQRKISNALLYHAYKELPFKAEHEITIKQLCKLIGYHGNNHAAIRDALRELLSTVIEWNLIDEISGAENWTASSIIASVCMEGPLCYYAYSPRMKQLLHSPSMFGKIDLVIQSKFRSSYGLALYENCIRYRGLPHTKWFDIALFKKLMGVPKNKYDIFRDFKRRVLDKAIDEVNTYSDLVICSEFTKEGRRVVRIRFKLKERAKKSRLGGELGVRAVSADIALRAKLESQYGLSREQLEQAFNTYDEQFIKEKMDVIEASRAFQMGKIQNLAAYLFSALKNNYQTVKAKTLVVEPLPPERNAFDLMEIKREIDGLRAAYGQYREDLIQNHIDSLKMKKKQKFYKDFQSFAEPVIHTILQLQRNKYSRENVLESPQIKALMRRFAIRELDILSLPSLEEYVAIQPEKKRAAWQKLKSYDPDHDLLRFND